MVFRGVLQCFAVFRGVSLRFAMFRGVLQCCAGGRGCVVLRVGYICVGGYICMGVWDSAPKVGLSLLKLVGARCVFTVGVRVW